MNDDNTRRDRVREYYTATFRTHGASPRGVDWNSDEAQRTRFHELARILPTAGRFSVLDFGCGYGAFFPYLRAGWPLAEYVGVDVVPEMVYAARVRHADDRIARFEVVGDALPTADFAIMNGVFHIRQDELAASWEAYARGCIQRVWEVSDVGMAFNVLSLHSDADRRGPHLYYGAPEEWLAWCIGTFGRHVSLLHDYGLYEFTMLVRRSHTGDRSA